MNKKHIEKLEKTEVSVFEKKLHDMASSGELDSFINKIADQIYNELIPTPLSEVELKSLYQTVKKASQKKALKYAKKYLTVNLVFGRLLQFLRKKSGLTQIDIARLLHKDRLYIENLENCQINPLKIPLCDLVDILELFRINLSEFVRAVKEYATLLSAKKSKVSAMARSSVKAGTKERGESLSHAIDSVLLAIAKKEGQNHHTDVDSNLLEELKKELIKRGSNDLLI
jgi:transcriptional regulator with XRE-family HTH domain